MTEVFGHFLELESLDFSDFAYYDRHQKTEIFYPNLDNDDNANDCEGDAKYETSVNDYDK